MKEDSAPERDTVEIHGLSSSGDGVGRGTDGRTLFVPLTAPGDRVGVRIVRKRKRYGHAALEAIERAAPERVTPKCELFGYCGGCDWQHLAYEQQRQWKGQIVQQTLQRVGKIDGDIPPVHGAPEPYSTRSRARLPVSSDRRPGFFRRGSRKIVEVSHCPVLTAPLNRLLAALFAHLPTCPLPVESVRLLGAGHELALSLHLAKDAAWPDKATLEDTDHWAAHLRALLLESPQDVVGDGQQPSLNGVSWWRGREQLGAWEKPFVLAGEVATAYRPEGFAQASFACNETLVARVLSLCAPMPGDDIVEVYAGRGNLSLSLAQAGARVLALDNDQQALKDGLAAAKRAGLEERVAFGRFHDRDGADEKVAKHYCSLATVCRTFGHDAPQKLLLDPPRQGLSPEVCEEIIAMAPADIFYVSCDPATLARDLKKLCSAGYELQHLEVIDLIPQTAHVESLAHLVRSP